MSQADRSYSYRTSCGQIAGRSHLQSNAPCQDYVAARAQRDVACIALADGAGSRSHSEHGARVVVKATTRLLMDPFEEIWALAGTNPSQVTAEVLDHCLTALQRQASERNCTVSALASTLLSVAHSKGRFLAGHVGDGCIIHLQDDGQIVVLSHPDNGEYANTTFFVTDAIPPPANVIIRQVSPLLHRNTERVRTLSCPSRPSKNQHLEILLLRGPIQVGPQGFAWYQVHFTSNGPSFSYE